MAGGKTVLNPLTGDVDGFDDTAYGEDLDNINSNNATLENRVSNNENNIGTIGTTLTSLDGRVGALEGVTGLTQTVTVKASDGITDINLGFDNGILTSIT